ncbi:hypothetical protein FNV43_RR19400 [Rhamnella rubrinervis]|uniref:Uncharacterized protein n=1 Tax=Rhamnella rubrinervis TaxID=2594499 RepID=A0A8K0DYH0_9ROSA|nr:hypothetical protein FNV43_RR19400 [Rhamnella rubrinervis]
MPLGASENDSSRVKGNSHVQFVFFWGEEGRRGPLLTWADLSESEVVVGLPIPTREEIAMIVLVLRIEELRQSVWIIMQCPNEMPSGMIKANDRIVMTCVYGFDIVFSLEFLWQFGFSCVVFLVSVYEEKKSNAIMVEKIVSDEIDSTFGICLAFDMLGWVLVLNFEGNYYPQLVREFYANIEDKDDVGVSGVVLFVKGCRIKLHRATLAHILGVLGEGPSVEFSNDVRASSLNEVRCFDIYLLDKMLCDLYSVCICCSVPDSESIDGVCASSWNLAQLVHQPLHAGEVFYGRNALVVDLDDEEEHSEAPASSAMPSTSIGAPVRLSRIGKFGEVQWGTYIDILNLWLSNCVSSYNLGYIGVDDVKTHWNYEKAFKKSESGSMSGPRHVTRRRPRIHKLIICINKFKVRLLTCIEDLYVSTRIGQELTRLCQELICVIDRASVSNRIVSQSPSEPDEDKPLCHIGRMWLLGVKMEESESRAITMVTLLATVDKNGRDIVK